MSLTSAVVTGALWLFPTGSNPLNPHWDVTDLWSFIRRISLVTVLGGLLILIVRFELMKVESVQEGTVAARTSWGKPRYYRSNHRWLRLLVWFKPLRPLKRHMGRKGRLVLLLPGGHLMVKGMHGLIVVNFREELVTLPAQDLTFKGRTLHLPPLDVNWRTVWQDNAEGDRLVENRVWFMADNNVHDLAIGNYEAKLHSVLKKALNRCLKETEADEQGFPVLRLASLQQLAKMACQESEAQLVAGRMMKFILPELTMLGDAPMSWTEGQLALDAAKVRRKGAVKAARIEGEALVAAAEINARARVEAAHVMSHQPWLRSVDGATGTDD